MPLTIHDPHIALIVVDLQKGAEAHEYRLKHVFPRLGETGSTQDVLDLLAKRSV